MEWAQRAKKMRVKEPKKGVFLPFTGSCSLYQFPYIIYTYAVSGKFWPHTFYEQDEKACFCRKKAKKSEHFFQKIIKNHRLRIYTALFSGLLGLFLMVFYKIFDFIVSLRYLLNRCHKIIKIIKNHQKIIKNHQKISFLAKNCKIPGGGPGNRKNAFFSAAILRAIFRVFFESLWVFGVFRGFLLKSDKNHKNQ